MSLPRILIHIEGAAIFASAIFAYASLEGSLLLFLVLLLVPDLGMLGYLHNAQLGSMTYNAVHTYAAPLVLAGVAVVTGWELGLLLAIIWTAHIGMDRMVGYGLKYPTQFKETHINRV
jgi:hypothetical protein